VRHSPRKIIFALFLAALLSDHLSANPTDFYPVAVIPSTEQVMIIESGLLSDSYGSFYCQQNPAFDMDFHPSDDSTPFVADFDHTTAVVAPEPTVIVFLLVSSLIIMKRWRFGA
jgi:hypothetical protein